MPWIFKDSWPYWWILPHCLQTWGKTYYFKDEAINSLLESQGRDIFYFKHVYGLVYYTSLLYLSFIDQERGGFGGIIPEVMIRNIITEGNVLPNPLSGGSINDILYRR
jgi:hypothetical protein